MLFKSGFVNIVSVIVEKIYSCEGNRAFYIEKTLSVNRGENLLSIGHINAPLGLKTEN